MSGPTASLPPTERQSWVLHEPVVGIRIAGTSRDYLLSGRQAWGVGRAPVVADAVTGSIVIDSPHVSERHCTIELRNGRWIVLDQGSRNGLYLGDEKERRTMIELVPGVTFRIASIPLVAYSDAGRRGYMLLQRYLGFADAFQLEVEAALRVAATRRHVVLVQPPGGDGIAVARILHDASSRASWPFEVVKEVGASEREQIALLDRAVCGSIVVRADAFPGHRAPLRGWLAAWQYNVRLFAIAPTGVRLAPLLGEELLRETAVIPIPTLARRTGEVAQLAAQLGHDVSVRLGRLDITLTPDDLAAITAREWPGNIEELHTYVERVLALRAHGGNAHQAARWLGKKHNTILAWRKRYGAP